MAITLITGVPGAGKTFYAVKFLRDNFYNWNKENQTWKKKKDITVITNIESLHLEHLLLEDILEKTQKPIKIFFSLEYQKKIHEKYKKIVYFIDEAQFFFDRRFYEKEVFQYFQYHRHLSDDIILCTQDFYLLPAGITSLIETELRAVKRTLSFFGEFKYNVLSNKQIIDRKLLKPDKKIFDLYKSADGQESLKIVNPFKKWIYVTVVMIALSIYFFYSTFISRAGRDYSKEDSVLSSSKKNGDSLKSFNSKDHVKNPKSISNVVKKIDNKKLSLSYYVLDDHVFVLNPFTDSFCRPKSFPYPIKILKRNSCLKVFAVLPLSVYNSLLDL